MKGHGVFERPLHLGWKSKTVVNVTGCAEADSLDSNNLSCNYLHLYSLVSGSAVTGNLHGVKWANVVT